MSQMNWRVIWYIRLLIEKQVIETLDENVTIADCSIIYQNAKYAKTFSHFCNGFTMAPWKADICTVIQIQRMSKNTRCFRMLKWSKTFGTVNVIINKFLKNHQSSFIADPICSSTRNTKCGLIWKATEIG